MRPIDADALIEFIENRYDITWKDDYEGGIKDACVDILEKISNMLTIEPERTGKWIKEKSRGQLYQCSACGNYLDFRGVNVGRGSANFCPNCGCLMMEE